MRKEVRSVTITYADGETETFDPILGIHRTLRNNVSHERDYKNIWLDHEVRWSAAVPSETEVTGE